MSDFIDSNDFSHAVKIANKKHDLVALQILDKRELEMPNLGLVPMLDSETGALRYIDTSSRTVRESYSKNTQKRQADLENSLKRAGVDFAQILTHESYVKALMSLFKKRESRR
jgi:uncharacterized protein (DUF58 family)